MPKKISKKSAWRIFSLYIRTRDCIETTGFPDQGRCVTCNGCFPIEGLQAGHAIGGRNNSILFDEQLVNAQCRTCNMGGNFGKSRLGFDSGRYAEYSVWFIKKYGLKTWENKVRLSNEINVDLNYDEIYKMYKEKLSKLLKKANETN